MWLAGRAAEAARVSGHEEALARIKRIHGLLPVCAYCKRIRIDENLWEPIGSDLGALSGVEFSHGICPTCYERVQREIDRR